MSIAEVSRGKLGRRHYILVVHGIGEQKVNQTTTPVVHRFAEVRQNKAQGHFKNLIPSYLSAQSVRQGRAGHGWSEFEGIPVDPKHPTGNFDGTSAAESSGLNFRFVDLHWQHILQRHQALYSSPIEEWVPALLARTEDRKMTPAGWTPEWTLPLLRSIVNVAIPIHQLLAFKYSSLSKTIFDDFLGDVHLYGDYARTRGKAVRHFHVILDEIMLQDFIDWCRRDRQRIHVLAQEGKTTEPSPYLPPRFTIIAHSLGSIMSFDALVYAHAKEEIRRTQGTARNTGSSLPFLGYTYAVEAEEKSWASIVKQLKELEENNGLAPYKENFSPSIDALVKRTSAPEIPLLTWIGQVKDFITIGSPIDKYHVMWWQQYLHMGLRKSNLKPPAAWSLGINDWLNPPQEQINHYNFCDEQDPVGHHLDVARGTVNYRKIFNPDPVSERDVVFRRYAKPGVAHNVYWEDKELFKGFIEKIIDGGNVGSYFLREDFRDGKRALKQALLWAYFRIPFIAAMITGAIAIYALFGDVTLYRIAAGVGAILLWTQPNLLAAYRDEARPEEFDDTRLWQRIKTLWIVGKLRLKKGILARVVSGMVEWRRILLKLSEGIQTRPDDVNERVAFQTGDSKGWTFWWRFSLRVIAAMILAYLLFRQLPADRAWQQFSGWTRATLSALILTLSYIAVLLYVAYEFVMAKYFRT